MAKRVSAANIKCGQCGCEKFIVGNTFPQAGGHLGYTLRCAQCFDKRGDSTYVQNISQAAMDLLINQGRILAEPLTTNPAKVPAPANPADMYPAPPEVQVHRTPTSAPTTLGVALPPAYQSGRNMQPSDDDVPFEARDVQDVPPPPFISSPGVSSSAAPSMYAPMPTQQVTQQLAKEEPTAAQSLCVACTRGLPVKIAASKYVCRLSSSSLVYSDELTGSILFTQKISFCPFCGKKLD